MTLNETIYKVLGPKKVTSPLLPLRRRPLSHTVNGMGNRKKVEASTLHREGKIHFSKIAALVKRERAAQGISLRELALCAKMSHQQVLRVERGICSIDSALTVLKALDVSKAKRAKVVTSEMYAMAMAS